MSSMRSCKGRSVILGIVICNVILLLNVSNKTFWGFSVVANMNRTFEFLHLESPRGRYLPVSINTNNFSWFSNDKRCTSSKKR